MSAPVLFCGAWDEGPGYPRTTALRQGLAAHAVPVAECRLPADGAGKRRLVRQPWRWPLALLRAAWRRRVLLRRLRASLRAQRPAAVLVPYPGHLLVGAVAARSPVPVVLDLFLSAYDTAVGDRRWFAPGSLPARLLRGLDRRACAAADLVLVDTPENAEFAARLTGLPRERFAALPIGDPDAPAAPAPYPAPAPGRLTLLFFGTGVPLHGLPTLLAAAAQVASVDLILVGGTPAEREVAVALLGSRLELQPPFVPRARLQELLDRCHLVAGVFGTSDKAQRVVPFKVVHALASGRPVVTADTPAMRRVLTDGDGGFLVPPGDPAALTARLTALAGQPAALARAAAGARACYDAHFAVARSGATLCRLLADLGAEVRR